MTKAGKYHDTGSDEPGSAPIFGPVSGSEYHYLCILKSKDTFSHSKDTSGGSAILKFVSGSVSPILISCIGSSLGYCYSHILSCYLWFDELWVTIVSCTCRVTRVVMEKVLLKEA